MLPVCFIFCDFSLLLRESLLHGYTLTLRLLFASLSLSGLVCLFGFLCILLSLGSLLLALLHLVGKADYVQDLLCKSVHSDGLGPQ